MDYWLSGRRTFHHQIFDIVVPQKELVNFYNLVFYSLPEKGNKGFTNVFGGI